MRQLTAFLILLAASLVAAGPAQACHPSSNELPVRLAFEDVFWSTVPVHFEDELVFRVRYLRDADIVPFARDTTIIRSSCGGPAKAPATGGPGMVLKVLQQMSGPSFSGGEIVVAGFSSWRAASIARPGVQLTVLPPPPGDRSDPPGFDAYIVGQFADPFPGATPGAGPDVPVFEARPHRSWDQTTISIENTELVRPTGILLDPAMIEQLITLPPQR